VLPKHRSRSASSLPGTVSTSSRSEKERIALAAVCAARRRFCGPAQHQGCRAARASLRPRLNTSSTLCSYFTTPASGGGGTHQAARAQRFEGLSYSVFVVRDYRVAIRLLVTGQGEGVQGERVILGRCCLLFRSTPRARELRCHSGQDSTRRA